MARANRGRESVGYEKRVAKGYQKGGRRKGAQVWAGKGAGERGPECGPAKGQAKGLSRLGWARRPLVHGLGQGRGEAGVNLGG
jgi:hypothetical protein